jgi:hypothetical protein
MTCYNQKNDSRALFDRIVQPIPYISASWDHVAFIRQFLVDCSEVELVSAPSSSLACPLPQGRSLQSPPMPTTNQAPGEIASFRYLSLVLVSFKHPPPSLRSLDWTHMNIRILPLQPLQSFPTPNNPQKANFIHTKTPLFHHLHCC